MLVRFTAAVLVPGGPQYGPGEQAVLGETLAQRYLALGWAEPVPVPTAAARDVQAPPVHRMIPGAPRRK